MIDTELKEHLRLHMLWLQGDSKGSRANLYGADLSGANLSGADLSKTLLEGKALLSFQFEQHTAYFYGTDEIRIGCHVKSIGQWLETYVEVGKAERYTDKQIEMYGRFIKQCASLYKENANEKA